MLDARTPAGGPIRHLPSAVLPEALLTWGRVAVRGPRQLVAGEHCTIGIEATLARPLPSGYSVELWTHFVSNIERPQQAGVDETGYFACRASGVDDQGAPELEVVVHPDAAVHGPNTFFPYRRYAGCRLLADAAAGTRLVFELRNVAMQTYEEPVFNLRLAILEDEHRLAGYLGDALYEVIGDATDRLHVVGPTCVQVGEPFQCYVVARDRYRNRSGAPLADAQLVIQAMRVPSTTAVPAGDGDSTTRSSGRDSGSGGDDGTPPAMPVETTDLTFDALRYDSERRAHVHVIEGARCAAAGVYVFGVALADAPHVSGESNPLVARREWPEKVYWGDLHQHSYHDDGRGVPEGNYAYARNGSALDFCAITPHQESVLGPPLHRLGGPPQRGWEELIAAAEAWNGPDLVTILGSEASSLQPLAGHMNAYYLDHKNRPEFERLAALGVRPAPGASRYPIERYEQYLEVLEQSEGEFLLLPHAHAGGGPGKFDLPKRPEYQTNVEICSLHGVFEEFYRAWLRAGHLVGVNGGGDNHMTSTGNANPGFHYPNTNGLAAVYASEKTRPGIWHGIRQRHTYAVTANQRLFVDLSVDGHPMGTVARREGDAHTIRVEVAGTAPILKVELFRGDAVIQTYRPSSTNRGGRRALRLVWTDSYGSRRVDDSATTGWIVTPSGPLHLLSALNNYTRTDSFVEDEGAIRFRSNGYSGITRGVLLDAPLGASTVQFAVADRHLGQTVLEEQIDVPLTGPSPRVTRPLRVDESLPRWSFAWREPQLPEFSLHVDWVDLDWPRACVCTWHDTAGPEHAGASAQGATGATTSGSTGHGGPGGPGGRDAVYYYVRVEQIDGALAWSNPVWLR